MKLTNTFKITHDNLWLKISGDKEYVKLTIGRNGRKCDYKCKPENSQAYDNLCKQVRSDFMKLYKEDKTNGQIIEILAKKEYSI